MTLGSLDAVLAGRKIREKTLLFFRESAREVCEAAPGGAEGGRITEEMDGAVGDGARIDGSRECEGRPAPPRAGVPWGCGGCLCWDRSTTGREEGGIGTRGFAVVDEDGRYPGLRDVVDGDDCIGTGAGAETALDGSGIVGRIDA
jgi:hypothetical protein